MYSFEDHLRMLVSADTDPILSGDEIQMIISLNSVDALYPSWKANTAYAVGQRIVPSPRTGGVFEVTTAGTSGATQPVWLDAPTTDEDVVWAVANVNDMLANLRRAAAQGWRIKAGKCSNRVDFKTDVTQIMRDQMYKHCMDQYKSYMRGAYGTVPVISGYKAIDPVIGNLPS